MWYWFTKILEQVLWPLNLAIICSVMSFFISLRRGDKINLILSSLVLLVLVPTSIPAISNPLFSALDHYYEVKPIADYEHADAIVVLGGTVAQEPRIQIAPEELAGSRLLTAARLLRSGKADRIVVSSGIQYETIDKEIRTEAEDMRDILIDMGIPLKAIFIENESRSTEENAYFTARILIQQGRTNILLVSSPQHLRRAVFWFEQAGLHVMPAPAGHHLRTSPYQLRDYLPSPRTLQHSTGAIKEIVGHSVAVLKGALTKS